MGALLVALRAVVQQGEGMLVKRYGKKHSECGMFFNAITCLFSVVFFLVTDKGGLCFPEKMFVYGFVSCILFATGFYAMYVALKLGSFVATMLISSFSGVISVCYGILFLKEQISIPTYIAIVLVFVSVFLMRYEKNNNAEKKKVSVKWLLWALLSAVSNGFIAVVSRTQQIYFENAYDNEFMICSFGGAFVVLLVLGMFIEKDKIKSSLKYVMLYGMATGLLNGAKNLIGLGIYLFIPLAIATPVKTGSAFLLSFFVSLIIYKEKFTKQQVTGVILGILALIMFNL